MVEYVLDDDIDVHGGTTGAEPVSPRLGPDHSDDSGDLLVVVTQADVQAAETAYAAAVRAGAPAERQDLLWADVLRIRRVLAIERWAQALRRMGLDPDTP